MRDVQMERKATEEELTARLKDSNGLRQVCDVVWCGVVWCGVVWCGVV